MLELVCVPVSTCQLIVAWMLQCQTSPPPPITIYLASGQLAAIDHQQIHQTKASNGEAINYRYNRQPSVWGWSFQELYWYTVPTPVCCARVSVRSSWQRNKDRVVCCTEHGVVSGQQRRIVMPARA